MFQNCSALLAGKYKVQSKVSTSIFPQSERVNLLFELSKPHSFQTSPLRLVRLILIIFQDQTRCCKLFFQKPDVEIPVKLQFYKPNEDASLKAFTLFFFYYYFNISFQQQKIRSSIVKFSSFCPQSSGNTTTHSLQGKIS